MMQTRIKIDSVMSVIYACGSLLGYNPDWNRRKKGNHYHSGIREDYL